MSKWWNFQTADQVFTFWFKLQKNAEKLLVASRNRRKVTIFSSSTWMWITYVRELIKFKIDFKVEKKIFIWNFISDFRTHSAATGSAFATRRNLRLLKIRTFPRNRVQRPNRRNLDVRTPTGSFRFQPVFRFQRRVESAERHGRKKRRRPDSNRRFSFVRR